MVTERDFRILLIIGNNPINGIFTGNLEIPRFALLTHNMTRWLIREQLCKLIMCNIFHEFRSILDIRVLCVFFANELPNFISYLIRDFLCRCSELLGDGWVRVQKEIWVLLIQISPVDTVTQGCYYSLVDYLKLTKNLRFK